MATAPELTITSVSVENNTTLEPATASAEPEVVGAGASLPTKRARGRPKGSKNKQKVGVDGYAAVKKPRTGAKPAARTPTTAKKMTVQGVNAILKAHGVTNVSNVSMCLKAGILNGYVKLLKPEDDPEKKFGLDQVIARGNCLTECDSDLECTIKDILYQPDYGGMDYEDGGESATFRCPGEDCAGIYVTNICEGNPSFDCGKFHNHCKACPGFGMCIGDYREVHCRKCGSHFYGLAGRGKCYMCHPKQRSALGDFM